MKTTSLKERVKNFAHHLADAFSEEENHENLVTGIIKRIGPANANSEGVNIVFMLEGRSHKIGFSQIIFSNFIASWYSHVGLTQVGEKVQFKILRSIHTNVDCKSFEIIS